MSSFKDVVGHKNIIKYISSAVQADAVSHAYILNGERGSGKRLLANLFAMSLQCQNRAEDGEACGKCQSCKQAQLKPQYAELCRRFLADAEDFSEENLERAGIKRRFQNIDKETCMEEILREINVNL